MTRGLSHEKEVKLVRYDCGLFHEKGLTLALELMAWDCFPNCSFL